MKLGRLDASVEHYRRAAALMPNSAVSYFDLGTVLDKLRNRPRRWRSSSTC